MNKLKLCPFCGSEIDTAVTAYRLGGACVVLCSHCRAGGPVVMIEDFLDFGEDITNEAWDEAVDKAKAAAVEKWNTRPPMTNMTAEDLAVFDQFGETIESLQKKASGSLYGKNCREG